MKPLPVSVIKHRNGWHYSKVTKSSLVLGKKYMIPLRGVSTRNLGPQWRERGPVKDNLWHIPDTT